MKTSNKFAIVIAMTFILLPGIGYVLERWSMEHAMTELTTISEAISTDTIKTVVVSGKGAKSGLLSVLPLQYEKNKIDLNVRVKSMHVNGDTLHLIINDDSPVYHGYIHIRHLKTAIINSDTIEYKLQE